MTTALIGYTGFVGSTLLRQRPFDALYRSTNIEEIRERSFDLVVCAGAPAAKWIANQEPEKDRANLQTLMNSLEEVTAGSFVLISTVDVYRMPPAVDEETPIDPLLLDPYGRHRYFLEEFIRHRFDNSVIVRLPGLFGRGLKKNFIYDLLHNNCPEWTHCDSVFQFYDLEGLWTDLQGIMESRVPLINMAAAPVSAADVARECFNMKFSRQTEKPPVYYDMRTRMAHLFGGKGDYLFSEQETFERIRAFIKAEKETSLP